MFHDLFLCFLESNSSIISLSDFIHNTSDENHIRGCSKWIKAFSYDLLILYIIYAINMLSVLCSQI